MPHLTLDRNAITRAAVMRATVQAVGITTVAAIAAVLLIHQHVDAIHAIRAAIGQDAVAPANAGIITKLLADIQGNWYWFLLGTLPLALSILLGAVALGVRSASDWLFKLLLGIVGIIAFAPAIVA